MSDIDDENGDLSPEPIVIPIEDEIDLHTFSPREVRQVLEEYFLACREKGLLEVRVIHGKGRGFLKAGVSSFLEKCPLVLSFRSASPEMGGWGATIVRLRPDPGRD